jgi:hypothetical protein
MASKGHYDVSLKIRSVPASQAAPDLRNHRHFKQATAGSAQKAAHSKDLSQQEYRHSTSQQIRRMLQRSGSTVWVSLLSNVP